MDIVVVGSVALDSVQTPFGTVDDALGGSATFFSVAASYFTQVKLVAVVGEDLPADAHALFAARGIDTGGLEVTAGKCFRWGGRYHDDMNQRDTLFTHLNVFERFHPKLPDDYRSCGILFLANIHPALQLEVLEQIERPPLVAVDTMNLWIDSAREDLVKVLSKVDLVFLNDEETRLLSGRRNLVDAVRELHAMGPRMVVVKKGEHGACLFTPEQRFVLPAMLLEKVFDPTGAGDTFAGGFLGFLAQGDSLDESRLREAMVQGTVMASYVTEDFSVDRIRDLSDDDRNRRRQELENLTSWGPRV